MKPYFLYVVTLFVLLSCNSSKNQPTNCDLKKITFNIKHFDERGLYGNDKTAVDYEFCVPNNTETIKAISEIDSSIKLLNGKGRTKCKENQLIMIGNSYNKDIKTILCKLSQLDFITEINQVFWE